MEPGARGTVRPHSAHATRREGTQAVGRRGCQPGPRRGWYRAPNACPDPRCRGPPRSWNGSVSTPLQSVSDWPTYSAWSRARRLRAHQLIQTRQDSRHRNWLPSLVASGGAAACPDGCRATSRHFAAVQAAPQLSSESRLCVRLPMGRASVVRSGRRARTLGELQGAG